jgi:methylenetetrahydrofolate--tRNA-(uracil-5-)-methyltransferase
MRPQRMTEAHQTENLAELVCSNSFRSDDWANNAVGLLHEEMRRAGSLVMAAGDTHKLPAGGALAVDRDGFSREVTSRLAAHPLVTIARGEIAGLPPDDWDSVIIATGPLTSAALGSAIGTLTGEGELAFFDAIAPIVHLHSVDETITWRQSRYDKAGPGGTGADYLNCPMNKAEYEAFIGAVNAGRKILPHDFEEPKYFESCMPIEVMAERGPQTLRFGPMRPIGLRDPRTGFRPWAVVQLRPENKYLTAYNLVGFQTRLAYPEQQRIFALIPALAKAEFLRFGSIHRNTYIDAPAKLGTRFELKTRPEIRFAGLLTGVEGYIESCAMGLVVAWLLAGELDGRAIAPPPPTTMLGGLYHHVTAPRPEKYKYGPTNVNYGLLPPLPGLRKDNKKPRMAERANADLEAWLAQVRLRAAS